MGRNTFNFTAIVNLQKDYEALGENLKNVVETSLMKSADESTQVVSSVMNGSNYPAGARYATGMSVDRIDEPELVPQTDDTYMVRWGLDLKLGDGVYYKTPIFLTYGTVKMDAVPGLKSSIFSKTVLDRFYQNLEDDLDTEMKKRGL